MITKKLLLISSLFLLSISMLSSEDSTLGKILVGSDDNESNYTLNLRRRDKRALRQCKRHSDLKFFITCLAIIKNGKFDKGALRQCSRHSESEFLNRCLVIIRNGKFKKKALRRCNWRSDSESLNRCLEELRIN